MPDKPTEEKYLPITDGILYKGCPDKKLMTFVEWLTKKMGVNKDLAKVSFEMLTHTAIAYGVHDKDCIFDNRLSKSLNENYLDSDLCRLCMLEKMLSEYHKYFKQNK